MTTTTIEVRYCGVRLGTNDKLLHLYLATVATPIGVAGDAAPTSKREIWFAKQLEPLYHRVGDVLTLKETKKDGGASSFSIDGYVRHDDGAEDEAADVAARQHHQSLVAAKKEAGRSDLQEALEPLQRAYRRLPAPQRAALVTWVVRQMMGWR